MSTGEVFSCPFGGWLDNGSGAVGPGSRTVSCISLGEYCHLQVTCVTINSHSLKMCKPGHVASSL